MILYINNEICYDIEQLRSYFNPELKAGSVIYEDLLSYGRNGVISKWLYEQGEDFIADRVDNIATSLNDSDYIDSLWWAVCGIANVDNSSLKIPIEECLQYIDSKINVNQNCVSIQFKVLKEVNEEYTIFSSCRLGVYTTKVNLSRVSEGEIIKVEIPIDNIDEVDWLSINSKNHEFHKSYRCPRTIYIKIRNTWLSLERTPEGYYYTKIPFVNWLALLPVGSTKHDLKYINRSYVHIPFFMEAMGRENRMQKIRNFLSLMSRESMMKFELHTQVDSNDQIYVFPEGRILNINDEEGNIPVTLSHQEYLKNLEEGNNNILNPMCSNFGIFDEQEKPIDSDEALGFLSKRLKEYQDSKNGRYGSYLAVKTIKY